MSKPRMALLICLKKGAKTLSKTNRRKVKVLDGGIEKDAILVEVSDELAARYRNMYKTDPESARQWVYDQISHRL